MYLSKRVLLTKIAVFFVIIFISFVFEVQAQEPKESQKAWTFSIYFENDLFTHTDQHYTNGTKLSWISPDLTNYEESGKLPDWSLPLVHSLPFINEPDLQRNIALSIGQNMYTPGDISRKDLIEDDRPYAGWTYFGIAFHSKNDRRLDSIEFQVGIVGPESFTEQTQKFVHSARGINRPNGWDNQLKNEPGLNIIYERKWRLLEAKQGLGFDTITHLGCSVGNVSTYANTGIEARFGWNIPRDFGVSLIRPAGDTGAPVDEQDPRFFGIRGFSLHFFTSIDGRAVLRDIFLDGNTFTDSHSVDKKHFVADIAAGISIIFHRFKLSYAQVFRTKEFREQEKEHTFGSITFSFTF